MHLSLILVPVDFSALTAPLLDYAAVLAGATGARVELLHVLDNRALADAATHFGAAPDQREYLAQHHLRELADAPAFARVAVATTVRSGDPDHVIPAVAASHGADLLLIGSHGASGLTRFLMGGTAEAALRAAPCPTLLVTAPAVNEVVLTDE